ncbi:MAG: pyridoxamine 5'-phosphate oxidase family protein [Deltaproteobacteria bacterium]|nr:pyridoxamine 5'-phosphate oxidase family protein [Deltaproteobacteria bacterium]
MANEVLERMKSLVRSHDTCVLATVSEGRPHCSLMAYATDETCGEIYMVTHRTTGKYRNLLSNPHVSLLVDTREEHVGHRRLEAQALTVEGAFRPIQDTERRLMAGARLTRAHPYLADFMTHPDAEIFAITVTSFLLLDGLSDAYYEKA